MSKLDLLLNDIEIKCDPAKYQDFIAKFMIDCLGLIEHKLPEAARAGLLVCRRYVEGYGSMQAIQHAVLDCWAAEGDRNWRNIFERSEISANRSVICLLKQLEGEGEDLVNSLSFFLNLANSVEAHEEEQEALLRRRFESCL